MALKSTSTIRNKRFKAARPIMSDLEIRTNWWRKGKKLINSPFNSAKFSADVSFWRDYTELTTRQAATEAGVAVSVINRIEKGKSPSMDNFILLCNWMYKQPSDYFEPAPGSVKITGQRKRAKSLKRVPSRSRKLRIKQPFK